MAKSDKYVKEETNLIIVSCQKFRDHVYMLSKKILQRISIGMYEVSCRTLKSSVRPIMGIKRGDDSDLTLKVENASDATSKLGNSTNLKNSTKLADSNMYLKNTQKIHS